MLKIKLLGQFSLRREGKTLEIPSRPAQSLFAYLILNRGVRHRRERLAGMFWPDSLESSARNNLRQALWRIRKSIEDKEHRYITSDRFHVGIDPEAEIWLDVDELVEELEDDAPVDEWLAVYKGELLPGFYDDWVVPERERLRIAFEQRGEKLLAHLERHKRWRELLDWGQNLNARAGPLEPAFRAIMRAYFELGDSAKAVATYERYVVALADEYGVEPSVDAKQIIAYYLPGDQDGPRATPVPAAELPPFLDELAEQEPAPFFARRQELAKLGERLEAALSGSGQVVFISGEAGSGKTAILREFTARAHAEHEYLLVAKGDCNALTGPGDPYLPFRDVFGCLMSGLESRWSRGALTTVEARRAWEALPKSARTLLDQGQDLVGGLVSLAWLASVAPLHEGIDERLRREIGRHAEIEALGEYGSDQLQSGLFDECVAVFAKIAAEHPLIIVLDDLQWADLGSLDLLFHLCRRIETLPIIVLCAYRPDEVALGRDGAPHPLAKVIGELRGSFGEIEIDLSTDDEEDRTFVDALVDSEPNELDKAFRNSLFEQTGGHPLFTIELLRELEGKGDLVQDSRGIWTQAATLDWGKLPAKVEGVIEERVGRLEPRLLDVLNVASVEGETFTAEVVAPVVGLDEQVLIRVLSQELDKRHRLTVEKGTGRLNGRRLSLYSFRHRLFHRHIYGRLDAAEKTYLHEAIGKALESLYGEQAGEVAVQLARHFAESGDSVKAIRYLQEAGERARRLSANAEAVAHLRKALLLLGELPKGRIRDEYELSVMISLGAALIATKGYAAPEVEAVFDRAKTLCEGIGDTPQLFPALWGLWSFHIVRASHPASLELGQQLQHIAGRDPGLLLEAHRALGSTLLYMGEIRQARRHLQKAVELYDPRYHSGHTYHYGQNPLVACLSSLALAFWALGHPEASLEAKKRAVSYAGAIDHPHSLAYVLVLSAVLHYSRREWSETLSLSERAIKLSERHGFPLWLAVGRITHGAALSKLGDQSGGDILSNGLDAWQANGAGLGLPTYLGMQAEAQYDWGDRAAALETVDRALRLADDTRELIGKPELLRLNGEFLRSNAPKDADDYLKHSLQAARAQRSNSMQLRTLTSLCRHRLEQARRHTYEDALRRVYSRFNEGVQTPDLEDARNLLEAQN